jgi:HAD superfamily hydrolase (TIGR01484 family)
MALIKLVLADVDGTLVTHEKVLTPRAIASVQALAGAGVAFAITSGRPPRGMQMFVEPLKLTNPLAAFNGGRFVRPDLSLVEQHVLSRGTVEPILAMIKAHQLDAWIYRGNDWFVRERHTPHFDREEWTVKFPPTVVPDFAAQMDEVVKIVGISDDLDAVARCEGDILRQFSPDVHCKKTTPGRDQPSSVFAARRSLTTSMSPIHGQTRARSFSGWPRCLRSNRAKSTQSATCSTTSRCSKSLASASRWGRAAMR